MHLFKRHYFLFQTSKINVFLIILPRFPTIYGLEVVYADCISLLKTVHTAVLCGHCLYPAKVGKEIRAFPLWRAGYWAFTGHRGARPVALQYFDVKPISGKYFFSCSSPFLFPMKSVAHISQLNSSAPVCGK